MIFRSQGEKSTFYSLNKLLNNFIMKRREFIQKSSFAAALVAGGAMPLSAFGSDRHLVKITILHTNDMHSRIEPFPLDGGKFAGMGGMSKRASLIKKIRKEQPNVILLDSGDIFQGTPYFNYFGGELEFKLMSQMGYDAATIGNHDFDGGIEGLHKQLPNASFPFVIANYDFENTVMNGKTKKHLIIEKQGIKIGITGVGIELKGLVAKMLYKETKYYDPIESANEVATYLKKAMNCDYVICLSHLGYRYDDDKISDVIFARKTKNIDLILGGHTHTFLEQPVELKNLENQPVIINQAGWAGLVLGRLDLVFEYGKKHRFLFKKNNLLVT